MVLKNGRESSTKRDCIGGKRQKIKTRFDPMIDMRDIKIKREGVREGERC